MNDLPQISVMSLKPEDVLVFSTVDKLSAETYHRVEQKIINWKKESNITNKHLLLTSALELKVLRPEGIDNAPIVEYKTTTTDWQPYNKD